MPLERLDLLRQTLLAHLNNGFIVPSKAAYTSPVLFAPKPSGGWRFCIDYRRLNVLPKKDKYPSQLIEETFRRVCRAKVFTKLDIRQAFQGYAWTRMGGAYGVPNPLWCLSVQSFTIRAL